MTVLDSTHKWIAFDEGCELTAYWDSMGHVWTIGFGHTPSFQGQTFTPDEAAATLDSDIDIATSAASHVVGDDTFDTFDAVRQAAMVNMSFNLGEHKLSLFDTFLARVRNSDWTGAALDLLANTAWAKELPARAGRVAHAINSGEWPNV